MARKHKPHEITVEELLSTPDGIARVGRWLTEGHSIDDLTVPATRVLRAQRNDTRRRAPPAHQATPRVA